MTGTGLATFDILCRCGNDLEAVRESCTASSDAWVGLTQILQAIDGIIDALVQSTGLEEEDTDP